MKKRAEEESPNASEQIDAIISNAGLWKGKTLTLLRSVIRNVDPGIYETVKWKKPSKPEGVPVWELDGILCVSDILKNAVRLTFPKGAQIDDPKNLFNTRLDSKSVRAVDFREEDLVDREALSSIIANAVRLNRSAARK